MSRIFFTVILLLQAVEESLKSVNLFHGGVADRHVGKYSGGMKRRLSVAISLIGDPKVSFDISLAEPSITKPLIEKFTCYTTFSVISGKFSGCIHG